MDGAALQAAIEADVARRRLAAQRLAGEPFLTAPDALRAMGALQAQDYAAAKWGLGQRVAACTEAQLDALFDQGAILRTHVLRPTWHFVLPEDARWLQELTGPRVMAGLSARQRQLDLDAKTISCAAEVFSEALSGGRHLTRTELGEALRQAGVAPDGQRLPHLLAAAEHACVITSGPRRGRDFTYALLDDRAPTARRRPREEALTDLTVRYFATRGPATVRDFAWWSGLPISDVRLGVELAGDQLERTPGPDGVSWISGPQPANAPGDPVAHLLPNFDEITVAYRDRSALLDPAVEFDPSLFSWFRASSPEGALLSNIVTVDGRVRGAWRRTLNGQSVTVDLRLLKEDKAEAPLIVAAAKRLGHFLGRDVRLLMGEGRSTTIAP